MSQLMLAGILWRSPSLLPIAEAVIGFCVVAVVFLYPRQLIALAGPTRWVLPGLRTVALTALGLSILRPSAVRPSRPDEMGPVAVLLDCSDSMSAVDSNRAAADLVALADLTGRLPVATRSSAFGSLAGQVDALMAAAHNAVRAESDFEYARVAGRSSEQSRQRMERADDELAVQVERVHQSQSQGVAAYAELKQKFQELRQASISRGRSAWATDVLHKIEAVATAVSSAQRQADENLYRENAAVRKVCEEIAHLSRMQLAQEALSRPGGVVWTLAAENKVEVSAFAKNVTRVQLNVPIPSGAFSSDSTDMPAAIRQVISKSDSQVPQAIVLISDGRQVASASASGAAALSSAGVPVFCVMAAPDEVRDLSIESVSMPSSVYLGEKIPIDVSVRGPGFGGAVIEAEVHAGPSAIAHQTARIDSQERAQIHFEVDVSTHGVQPIEIRVKPLPGEASIANNSVQRWVKVVSDRIKVASFASEPTWDFQLLSNELRRTPWVTLTEGSLGGVSRLRLSPAQILDQDVIILNDVSAASLDYAQWDAVHRLVEERGSSVILIAGDANWPGDYASRTGTQDLVPYVADSSPAWRMWSGDDPHFRFAPAPGAQNNAVVKDQRWEQAGGVFRFLQIPQLKANAQPLLVERESLSPVFTESRLGLGKVFFLGTNETWRWRVSPDRNVVNNDCHERFWLGLIHYAADEPYLERDSNWALDIDRAFLEPGQMAHVRAKRLAATQPTKLELWKDDRIVRTEDMNSSSSAGRYTAEIRDVSAATYALRLSGDSSLAIPVHVLSNRELELRDLSPDARMLKTIAESSGGEVIPLSQLPSLLPKLQHQRRERFSLHERALWDSGYLLVFVVGCLGLEWGLRKRLGLP